MRMLSKVQPREGTDPLKTRLDAINARCLELRGEESDVENSVRIAEIKNIQTSVELLVEKLRGCNGNRLDVESSIALYCKEFSERLRLLGTNTASWGSHEFLREE